MTKIELVQSYIEQCKNCKTNHKQLQYDIVGVFSNEISAIDNCLSYSIYAESAIDYEGNILRLQKKLENYLVDLLEKEKNADREMEKLRLQAQIAGVNVNVHNENNSHSTATATAETTIAISLDQTLEALRALPNETLSAQEVGELEDKLAGLDRAIKASDTQKATNKLSSIVKYMADKSVDAVITLLPYLGTIAPAIAQMAQQVF